MTHQQLPSDRGALAPLAAAGSLNEGAHLAKWLGGYWWCWFVTLTYDEPDPAKLPTAEGALVHARQWALRCLHGQQARRAREARKAGPGQRGRRAEPAQPAIAPIPGFRAFLCAHFSRAGRVHVHALAAAPAADAEAEEWIRIRMLTHWQRGRERRVLPLQPGGIQYVADRALAERAYDMIGTFTRNRAAQRRESRRKQHIVGTPGPPRCGTACQE